jgi:hypothetical protein
MIPDGMICPFSSALLVKEKAGVNSLKKVCADV